MKIAPEDRAETTVMRTLESMKKDLEKFRKEYKGNIKHAKKANNVIDEPYFDIALDQVSHRTRFFFLKSSKFGTRLSWFLNF